MRPGSVARSDAGTGRVVPAPSPLCSNQVCVPCVYIEGDSPEGRRSVPGIRVCLGALCVPSCPGAGEQCSPACLWPRRLSIHRRDRSFPHDKNDNDSISSTPSAPGEYQPCQAGTCGGHVGNSCGAHLCSAAGHLSGIQTARCCPSLLPALGTSPGLAVGEVWPTAFGTPPR
jgi:hypothetical protein